MPLPARTLGAISFPTALFLIAAVGGKCAARAAWDAAAHQPALRGVERRLVEIFGVCVEALQMHCGVNFFILDSRRVLARAPNVLGSDIKTHPKSRFCAILTKRGAL